MKRLTTWLPIFLAFGLGFLGGTYRNAAEAQRPSQLDILYNITSQNFYLTQKILAYTDYLKGMNLLLADKQKIKVEQVVPLTNKLQQEVFALDLKIKQVNP